MLFEIAFSILSTGPTFGCFFTPAISALRASAVASLTVPVSLCSTIAASTVSITSGGTCALIWASRSGEAAAAEIDSSNLAAISSEAALRSAAGFAVSLASLRSSGSFLPEAFLFSSNSSLSALKASFGSFFLRRANQAFRLFSSSS